MYLCKQIIYLQLPYFIKEPDDCNDIFERIIYVLKHMDVLERMPWMAQNAVFQRLSEIAEVASLNKDERQKYDASLRSYRDTLAVMEGQFLEGEAKGRAEGRAEGIADTARKMKSDGLPIDTIVKYTGLTTEEIGAL